MGLKYKEDIDLNFLQHCTEEQLKEIAVLLTHDDKGKRRLASGLLKHEAFKALDHHPEQYRRNWQLIAGELQHFGGDSIANKVRGYGLQYREILIDVSKRMKLKIDKKMSTLDIEQSLLEHFLRSSWQKMNETQRSQFLVAVDTKTTELEDLLPVLMQDKQLAVGLSHLLSGQLSKILRTHIAIGVIGHGLVRGVGLGGPFGAALNGVKAVSGSAYRVTIPAVLQIACLRRMIRDLTN